MLRTVVERVHRENEAYHEDRYELPLLVVGNKLDRVRGLDDGAGGAGSLPPDEEARVAEAIGQQCGTYYPGGGVALSARLSTKENTYTFRRNKWLGVSRIDIM